MTIPTDEVCSPGQYQSFCFVLGDDGGEVPRTRSISATFTEKNVGNFLNSRAEKRREGREDEPKL
jgi:hypothetical protein